jgi:hypothetical protein
MKKNKACACDPGNLTLEELEKQMANPDEIPFWRMHPAVQHCLRIHQELKPGTVEWKSKDACGWVPNINFVEKMFLEPYRLKAGMFNPGFIKGSTDFDFWNSHRD